MARAEAPQDFNYAAKSPHGAIFDIAGRTALGQDSRADDVFHGDADRNVPYDAVLYDGNGSSLKYRRYVYRTAHPALVLLTPAPTNHVSGHPPDV